MTEAEKDQQEARQQQWMAKLDAGQEAEETSLAMYQPHGFEQLIKGSQFLSSSALVPKALQGRPNDVAVIVATGWEEGLTWMKALRAFHPMFGSAVPKADYIRARCIMHPDVKLFQVVAASATEATVRVQRHGWDEPIDVTYTRQQAETAGYTKTNEMWRKAPEEMCVARATSTAARRHVPEVMMGLLSYEEAVDADLEGQRKAAKPVSQKAAKVAAALQEPEKEPAEEDVVDAEIVDEEPEEEAEPATTKLPPDVIARTAALLQSEVAGMGKKNTEALVDAGYVDLEKLAAATKKELSAVQGIGAQTAANLSEWAQARLEKRRLADVQQEPLAEPEEGPPADEAPYLMPPDREPPPCPPELEKRPIYRGKEYILGIGKACLKYGVYWEQLEKQAIKVSGGYPLDRLTNPEWEALIEWVKSGEQLSGDEAKDEGGEPSPKWTLVKDNLGGQVIDQRKVDRLLKAAERTGLEPDVEDQMFLAFGIQIEDLPLELYQAAWDLATGDAEGWVESLAELQKEGLIEEASDG